MSENSLPTVMPDDVEKLTADGWTLLDVRTDEEWSAGRIEGAVHIALDQLVARTDEVPEQVICVCAVGGRSARATAYLLDQGRDAANLDGGVQAWAASGRPLTA